MQIYSDDKRVYTDVIRSWVQKFRDTMSINPQDAECRPGDASGTTYPGIKIVFDGYGEDGNGNPLYNFESYMVFIHLDSLKKGVFPEHEIIPINVWGVIHRPAEEVCIYCWADINRNEISVVPFEDNNSTELRPAFVIKMIFDIEKKYNANL